MSSRALPLKHPACAPTCELLRVSCSEPRGWQLPEEVRGPHQGQVPGVHVGLATERGDMGQVSNQVFQGPERVHLFDRFLPK